MLASQFIEVQVAEKKPAGSAVEYVPGDKIVIATSQISMVSASKNGRSTILRTDGFKQEVTNSYDTLKGALGAIAVA